MSSSEGNSGSETTMLPEPPTAAGRRRRADAAAAVRLHARRFAAWATRGVVARLPWIAFGLAAAIPVISATVKALQTGWVPIADDGVIATRGLDVLTAHTPLVGQYSEAGLVIRGQAMHSPGPMLYWLIALPARFAGIGSLPVTMGVVNVIAIVACVALAHRRGGLVLMTATAVGIAVMCQSLATETFYDIWNPAAGLFPFLLLIFLCWSLACGDYRLLPVTVLVASYVTQTHLMYGPPTAVLLAVGLGGLFTRGLAERRRRRRSTRRQREAAPRVGRWVVVAVVVAAACWALPAVDQIDNSPGNLAMIVRTVEHRGPTLGPTVGWNAVVRAIGVRPWWLQRPASEWERKYDVLATGSVLATASAIVILVALVLTVASSAFALRWDLLAAALIGLGLCAAIAVEAAGNPAGRLLAGTLGYTMWWGSELGLWVWLILGWALWLSLPTIARRVRRLAGRRPHVPWRPGVLGRSVRAALAASLAALGGLVAVGTAVAARGIPDSHIREYRPTTRLAAQVERVVPQHVTIDFEHSGLDVATLPIEPALRFFLTRHGDRVLARGSFPREGSYYELYNRHYEWTVLIVDGIRPRRHMRLAARVRFTSIRGTEVVSVWVRHAPHPTVDAERSGRP
jgi:hypothetical protein